MAPEKTVPHFLPPHNSSSDPQPTASAPRCGVITAYGYNIRIRLDRGHLAIEDGIGTDRRHSRLPRIGHGLRRLIVVGNDGFISLAALRWLADQDCAFVLLERDGTVLCTTGPVRPSDARLRRAQALAAHSGADLRIARELISRKLAGQEQVARDKLRDATAAQAIADCRLALAETETMDSLRLVESKGAAAYWAAWRYLPVSFPKQELPRVPQHWRVFGTRKSLLTGSPRLATNPPNAILNYLYALLESEARLAVAALGLDPGLGFIHVDTPARDSLACDLMEAVRPQIDCYVLDFIAQQPLRREWFLEQRDGNCRLMATFAARLSETAPLWARAVAPMAEWIARQLWSRQRKPEREIAPPTRLTQRHKREAKGSWPVSVPQPTPKVDSLCRDCGTPVGRGRSHCPQCNVVYSTDRLREVARSGRVAAHSDEAQARRAETQRQHHAARHAWSPSEQPDWLTDEAYSGKILPLLARMSNSAIAKQIGVSRAYAGRIRQGYRPHPRYWEALAQLAGLAALGGAV